MKKVSLILALALVFMLIISSMAMAAPGQYTDSDDYRLTDPNNPTSPRATPGNDTALNDDLLRYNDGAKKEVIFAITPMKAGKPAHDGDYNGADFQEGTNANHSGYDADLTDPVTGKQANKKDTVILYAAGNTVIHGTFKTNTNACASCHMTHTAAGDALLIRNGIFNTCTACHDGTLGRLDVFDMPAYISNDTDQEVANFNFVGGGSFGGELMADTDNASMHLPTGYLEVAAAPGGNRSKSTSAYQAGTTYTAGNKTLTVNASAWTADFTCSSCHQPHGSYSDRLLAPNAANIGRYDGALVIADFDPVGDPATTTWKAWADPDGTNYDPNTTVNNDPIQIYGPWTFGESYSPGYTQTVFYQSGLYKAKKNTDGSTSYLAMEPDVKSEALIPKDAYKRVEDPVTHEVTYVKMPGQLNEMFNVNYAKGIATLKTRWNTIEDERFKDVDLTNIKAAIVPATVVKIEEAKFNGKWVDGSEVLDPVLYSALSNTYLEFQGFDATVTKWTGELKEVDAYTGNEFGNTADVDWTAKNGLRYVTFKDGAIDKYGTSARNGITWFCAGCHTDYYAEKFKAADHKITDPADPTKEISVDIDSNLEGTYSKAYRHTINRGALEAEDGRQNFIYEIGVSHGAAGEVLTCLGCHYAHGTSRQIMRNADDTQLAAGEKDVNPSSAIKRYVNMAVCYKCHAQQHADELLNSNHIYTPGADQDKIVQSNGYEAMP